MLMQHENPSGEIVLTSRANSFLLNIQKRKNRPFGRFFRLNIVRLSHPLSEVTEPEVSEM